MVTVDISYNHISMRIAIGADHAGFALKEHLVATLVRLGHAGRRSRHAQRGAGRLPADLRRRGADGRRRRRRSRHRHRRQRPGRADRRQQDPRRPRRALQRSLHRPDVARAQRRQRARHGRTHRRRSASPTRSSRSGSAPPFEGGRHQRRVDQITRSIGTQATHASMRTPIDQDRHAVPLAHARGDRPGDRRGDRPRAAPAEQRPRADRVRELRQPGRAARRPARC